MLSLPGWVSLGIFLLDVPWNLGGVATPDPIDQKSSSHRYFSSITDYFPQTPDIYPLLLFLIPNTIFESKI